MAVEQIGKVGGCLVVEGFVSEDEYFELNPLRDGEPVEFLEDGGDVASDAEGRFKVGEKNGVVDGVKSCSEVQEDEDAELAGVGGH